MDLISQLPMNHIRLVESLKFDDLCKNYHPMIISNGGSRDNSMGHSNCFNEKFYLIVVVGRLSDAQNHRRPRQQQHRSSGSVGANNNNNSELERLWVSSLEVRSFWLLKFQVYGNNNRLVVRTFITANFEACKQHSLC